tara:strand:+ start:273 stop:1658 length:1386 start_codon:yes stop_codon:yes gene_type:complete
VKTISSTLRIPFEDVVSALGGENYAYYNFDIKNIEEQDSVKKVQAALKVFVPQAKRLEATNNILGSLIGKYPESKVTPKGTSLDVAINDRQVIRVEVKPENSKGSGGGAAATKVQEAAQCVYAAIKYAFPNTKFPISEDEYRVGLLSCAIPGVLLSEIQALPQDWQRSSWNGANVIYNSIGGSDYMFVRGDPMIDDGAVKAAFNRIKRQTNLSSEDKWNPADIWMVRKNIRSTVVEKLNREKTIDGVNNTLIELNASGDLVGISLKKLGDSPSIALLNSTSPAERKERSRVRFVKYDLIFQNRRGEYPMDVYYYYGDDTYQKFQARNFGGPTKGDWKLELKGKLAAMGKIQGSVLRNLLRDARFTGIPNEPSWYESRPNNKSITDEIYKLLDKYNAQGFKRNKETKEMIDGMSQAYRYSKLSGLRLLDWFKTNGNRDKAMKELYFYASSQSDKSSVYYKLS